MPRKLGKGSVTGSRVMIPTNRSCLHQSPPPRRSGRRRLHQTRVPSAWRFVVSEGNIWTRNPGRADKNSLL